MELVSAFFDGIRLFNRGSYFEAHEAFEALLDEMEHDDRWGLLLALIQIAVGYHKWDSGYVGASRMLGLGAEKLAAFGDVAWDVDVRALRERVARDLARLADDAGAAPRPDDPPRIRLSRRRDAGA